MITLHEIGWVRADERGARIELTPEAAPGLAGLEGFSHAVVLWWAHHLDRPEHRTTRTVRSPYRDGPEVLGVHATRSPARANPLGLSVSAITAVLPGRGVLECGHLDAADGTPVVDIKPYQPSVDRVAAPAVPSWAADWPRCVEDSAHFDWDSVLAP